MKKKKQANKMSVASTKEVAEKESKAKSDDQQVLNDDEDSNQGFADWLKSSEGVGCMRLFVVANSIVVFTTMTWPHMSVIFESIGSLFNGESTGKPTITTRRSPIMIGAAIKGLFLFGALGWYSTNVWRTMNGYFRDEFKKHLAKENQRTKQFSTAMNDNTKVKNKNSLHSEKISPLELEMELAEDTLKVMSGDGKNYELAGSEYTGSKPTVECEGSTGDKCVGVYSIFYYFEDTCSLHNDKDYG